MVPLDFTEDDITWVVSKLSSVVGALGSEAFELRNWLIRFMCMLEEIKVIVTNMDDWISNYFPPWSPYCALMACRLVALDNRPGMRPVGIGEMLCRSLAKIEMRAAGDQAKTTCENLQIWTGLEARIEGETHAVG